LSRPEVHINGRGWKKASQGSFTRIRRPHNHSRHLPPPGSAGRSLPRQLIPIAPRIVASLSRFFKGKTPIGQLVKTSPPRESELRRAISWFLRPIQGIGLCLIAGEDLIELLQYGTGLTYSEQLARVSLFVLGNLVLSFMLTVVWTLDDLGLKLYGSTWDVNSAANRIRTILPMIAGAIGITNLFHNNTPIGVIHDEYTRPRIRRLHDSLTLERLEVHLS
jgi:hypothetical protein